MRSNQLYSIKTDLYSFLLVPTFYQNQFSVCADLSVTTSLDETMMITTDDGNGLDYAAAGEGVWVTIGSNVTTSGCAVGYADSGTPDINNTFNSNPTNAVLVQFNNDGSFTETSGTWTCVGTGNFKIQAQLNLAKIAGTGERTYYLRFIVNGSPVGNCATSIDATGADAYINLTLLQVLSLTLGDTVQMQIAETQVGGSLMQEMRLTYQLNIDSQF